MNKLKQRILIMAALGGMTLCANNRVAHAEQKLSMKEMVATTGATRLVGYICHATNGTCNDTEGDGVPSGGSCESSSPMPYSECIVDPDRNTPGAPTHTCPTTTVVTCRRLKWTPTNAAGTPLPATRANCQGNITQFSATADTSLTTTNGC